MVNAQKHMNDENVMSMRRSIDKEAQPEKEKRKRVDRHQRWTRDKGIKVSHKSQREE